MTVWGWLRRRRRFSPRERVMVAWLVEQMELSHQQVGFLATHCALRAAELWVVAGDLPPGRERSRLEARSLVWRGRADRLRTDRVAQ